jgi:hypothetical protein
VGCVKCFIRAGAATTVSATADAAVLAFEHLIHRGLHAHVRRAGGGTAWRRSLATSR